MRQYIKDHPWLLTLLMFICLAAFIGVMVMAFLTGGISDS